MTAPLIRNLNPAKFGQWIAASNPLIADIDPDYPGTALANVSPEVTSSWTSEPFDTVATEQITFQLSMSGSLTGTLGVLGTTDIGANRNYMLSGCNGSLVPGPKLPGPSDGDGGYNNWVNVWMSPTIMISGTYAGTYASFDTEDSCWRALQVRWAHVGGMGVQILGVCGKGSRPR
jgi:hypothetical protein